MKKKVLGMVLCAAMLTVMTAGCTPEAEARVQTRALVMQLRKKAAERFS